MFSDFKLYRKIHALDRGISLIEVVIVVFVATVLLFSVAQLAALSFRSSQDQKLELRAAYYAEESAEALRAMRDESWNARIGSLTASTTYYFVLTANAWTLSSANPGALDGTFTRTAVMYNVSRDAADDIVSVGGTNDPDTKKFTVRLDWNTQAGSRTLSSDTYLTNLLKN